MSRETLVWIIVHDIKLLLVTIASDSPHRPVYISCERFNSEMVRYIWTIWTSLPAHLPVAILRLERTSISWSSDQCCSMVFHWNQTNDTMLVGDLETSIDMIRTYIWRIGSASIIRRVVLLIAIRETGVVWASRGTGSPRCSGTITSRRAVDELLYREEYEDMLFSCSGCWTLERLAIYRPLADDQRLTCRKAVWYRNLAI